MKRIFCAFLIGISLLSACHSPVDERLEYALGFAGSNRSKLEKVLNHYRNDSLKLRAAKFLIENMPAYYSYKGSVLDSLHIALTQYTESYVYDEKRFSYLKQFPYGELEKEYDAKVIKADYLIENIEYSFKVWSERPWGKYISFDDFCEFLLPYRIKNEPLTRWKKELYERFNPVLDSICGGADVVAACDSMSNYLNRMKWFYLNDFNDPHVSASFLVDKRIGNCEDLCDYFVYVMRSVGIPVATDIYLYSPELAYSHAWNAVLDTTGRTIPFSGNEHAPQRGKKLMRKMGKAYRYCYGVQKMPLQPDEGECMPDEMRNCFLKDVSVEYFPLNRIEVDCEFVTEKSECPVWLATFSYYGWRAIGEGEYKKGKGYFRDIESGLIYATLHSKGGKLAMAGYPFIIDKGTGGVNYYRPEGESNQVVITRKYPLTANMMTYIERMTDGRFEGANRADFSDAELLLQVKRTPRKVFNEVLVDLDKKFRYVRYITALKYRAELGEMTWYEKDGDGKKLEGKLLYTPDLYTPNSVPAHAVDGDPLTYFSTSVPQAWVGLDFGEAKKIGRITYSPRNDDNFVRVGDVYELFYMSENGWKSLGHRKADSPELIYNNAPRHAVFWLRNLTRGVEEQLFSYYDEKQHFNYDRN